MSERDGLRELVLADGQQVRARFVVLAVGADYRRLRADGAERFEGRGLYYAATHLEALQASDEDVVVVGGGNSAGQAVVNLTSYARRIHLVVRRALTATMSSYLIDRIGAADNVEIHEGCGVKALHGSDEIDGVTVVDRDQTERRLDATAVFAMIGAARGPKTSAPSSVSTTRGSSSRAMTHGVIRALANIEETVTAGRCSGDHTTDVFAIGDVRSGSTKRVGRPSETAPSSSARCTRRSIADAARAGFTRRARPEALPSAHRARLVRSSAYVAATGRVRRQGPRWTQVLR